MNRAFYIVGIVFSVIFLFVTTYYEDAVSSARMDFWFSDFNYGYDSYNSFPSYDTSSYRDLTVAAALWSLFFFLCFIAIHLLGLLKVKTTTSKVISIIGLSLSGIFLFWDLAVMASPGSLSFDEVAPGWGFYCMASLAFTIVGLVQSVRYLKRKDVATNTISNNSEDLLDS